MNATYQFYHMRKRVAGPLGKRGATALADADAKTLIDHCPREYNTIRPY